MVTVGGVRVRVKVAADRRPCHERWQAPVARGLELARVLPELGWNIREPEDPVHLRLGFSGDADARLLADARHAEDLARSSERLEPRDGVHAEPVVEQPGGLGTEATDLEEGQEGRREAAAQLVELREATRRQVLPDLRRELAPDPRELRER